MKACVSNIMMEHDEEYLVFWQHQQLPKSKEKRLILAIFYLGGRGGGECRGGFQGDLNDLNRTCMQDRPELGTQFSSDCFGSHKKLS